MSDPSEYELEAWQNIQQFKGRPLSRVVRGAGQKLASGAAKIRERGADFLVDHPGAQAAVSRGQEITSSSGQRLSEGVRKLGEAIPKELADWGIAAADSTRRTVGRISRAGLSPKRVIAIHNKRGHDVSALRDLRRLDLEKIDAVGGRGASWYYPAIAAASGMSAGLVISGGELVTAASAGAAAAPSGAAVAGAFAGDAAVVLALSSRSVGHVSLLYGYDPEDPAEKLFVMSVVNAGTALSASAKTAAMSDISKLTQALIRGKKWDILNDSIISRVSNEFAKRFGFRLTKQGLGKVVPAVGIVVGGTFNWTTLESIIDGADVIYRRRFLLEKYPQLERDDAFELFADEGEGTSDSSDETISVLDELHEANGPDIRQEQV